MRDAAYAVLVFFLFTFGYMVRHLSRVQEQFLVVSTAEWNVAGTSNIMQEVVKLRDQRRNLTRYLGWCGLGWFGRLFQVVQLKISYDWAESSNIFYNLCDGNTPIKTPVRLRHAVVCYHCLPFATVVTYIFMCRSSLLPWMMERANVQRAILWKLLRRMKHLKALFKHAARAMYTRCSYIRKTTP